MKIDQTGENVAAGSIDNLNGFNVLALNIYNFIVYYPYIADRVHFARRVHNVTVFNKYIDFHPDSLPNIFYTQRSAEKGRALCRSPIFAHTGRVPARVIKTAGRSLPAQGKTGPNFLY